MYCEIFVPCLLGSCPESAVATAVKLAQSTGGRVVALAGASVAAPVANSWMYYPAEVYELLQESARESVQKIAGSIRERFARESVPCEVRSAIYTWFSAGELALPHARLTDLTVLALEKEVSTLERGLFASLLVDGGGAVLTVRAGDTPPSSFRHAAIAWKSTAQASRAIHEALPLLQHAETVDLLVVDSGGHAEDPHSSAESMMLAHLGRHDIQARLVRRPHVDGRTSPAILQYAQESGADFIVAGGYGRARASEFVFGGVTRTLIDHSPVPVFFAH